MDFNLEEGVRGNKEQIVESKDTAASYGSGLIEVFATPGMIALMELTCCSSVQEFLPKGWTTVGTEVCIKHTKATPKGMKARCESTLTKVDGKKLEFEVIAYDDEDMIGKGTHKRYIINEDKFMSKF
ncbi:MAG: thioesterase family protein [Bacteroidales bacterium]